MKKTFLLFIFLAFTGNIKAGDSLFVFKVCVGANYNHQEFEGDYTNNFVSHFSSGYEKRINNDTSSYSPLIRTGIQFKPTENLGIELTCSYRLGHFNYSMVYESSGYDPIDTSSWQSNTRIDNDRYIHNVGISLGPVLYINRLTLSPRILGSSAFTSGRIDSTYSWSEKNYVTGEAISNSGFGSSHFQNRELFAGGGLAIGYFFGVRKVKPYIETTLEYYAGAWRLRQNGFHASLTVGVIF